MFVLMFTQLVGIRLHPRDVSREDFFSDDVMAETVARCADIAISMQCVVDDLFPSDREVQ